MLFTKPQLTALEESVLETYKKKLEEYGLEDPGTINGRYFLDRDNNVANIMYRDTEVQNMLGSKPQPRTYFYQNGLLFNKGQKEVEIPEVHLRAFLAFIGKKSLHELNPDLFLPEAQLDVNRVKTTRYLVFFYSFIRFDIWTNGRLTLEERGAEITASARGFYQNTDWICHGVVEKTDSSIFINMTTENGKQTANRIKIAAEVNPATSDTIFRGTIVTKSSHGAYTAATEAVFINEDYYMAERDELNVRRYLFLRRNRFEVALTTQNATAGMLVGAGERLDTGRLETLTGAYSLEFHSPEMSITGKLKIEDDYRAYMVCALDAGNPNAAINKQILCFELSQPRNQLLVVLKGYSANIWPEHPDTKHYKAEMKHLISTLTITVPVNFEQTINGAFFTSLFIDANKNERLVNGAIQIRRLNPDEFELFAPAVQLH